MKILFIVPRIKSLFGDKGMTVHPHIGVAYLAAFLKKNGFEADVFDDGIEKEKRELFSLVEGFNPDLIGVTVFSYCYGYAYDLIKAIRGKFHIPLVLGGPHISVEGAKALLETDAEFGVKNEGEYTLMELLRELGQPHPQFSRIQGLFWREGARIVENPDRPFISDLDSLPFPDYEVFGIERYPCFRDKNLPLITSRGCPFACNYCSVRLSMGQRFRMRSQENVFAEIEYFYRQGWNNFDFNDDCFTLDRQRAEGICDLIIQNNLKISFQLYNGIRVDTVDPELLRKLKQAGCYFISYGCEAGNERVLKIIKKGITLEQVRLAVKWTKEAGIRNAVNFIIGHTGETYADAFATLKFAKSLPTDFVNFYNLLPYPGTESYQWAKEHASFLVPQEDFLKNISYRDNNPTFETKEFTRRQRKKIISLGFALYKKKILILRLGRALGNIVYYLTRPAFIDKFATNFALSNPLGKSIFMRLSEKSRR